MLARPRKKLPSASCEYVISRDTVGRKSFQLNELFKVFYVPDVIRLPNSLYSIKTLPSCFSENHRLGEMQKRNPIYPVSNIELIKNQSPVGSGKIPVNLKFE